MSLGVAIKGPEGIVLAADSRVTLQVAPPGQPAFIVNFDNTSKLLNFTKPHDFFGAVTYGQAVIGGRTAYSYIPEIEEDIFSKKESRLCIEEYSALLSDFFFERWEKLMPGQYQGPGMTFIVGGYDPNEAYGKIFVFDIPGQKTPEQRNADDFGMTWGGQLQVASRIIHGYDPDLLNIVHNFLKLSPEQTSSLEGELRRHLEFPVPYAVLPLQDCVNLAIYLIRSTISAQSLSVGIRGVGGLIEVAKITRTKQIGFVQKKEIRGEGNSPLREAENEL